MSRRRLTKAEGTTGRTRSLFASFFSESAHIQNFLLYPCMEYIPIPLPKRTTVPFYPATAESSHLNSGHFRCSPFHFQCQQIPLSDRSASFPLLSSGCNTRLFGYGPSIGVCSPYFLPLHNSSYCSSSTTNVISMCPLFKVNSEIALPGSRSPD